MSLYYDGDNERWVIEVDGIGIIATSNSTDSTNPKGSYTFLIGDCIGDSIFVL